MSHTPEPWKAVFRGEEYALGIDAKGPSGWVGDVSLALGVGAANARRIVACVNACEGVPTNLLEEIPAFEAAGVATVRSLRDQRDALAAEVAALRLGRDMLLNELESAHQIIKNALNIMTGKQKLEWGEKNAADGVVGEGVTRATERLAAIAIAQGREHSERPAGAEG